jgi:hypothetical protein
MGIVEEHAQDFLDVFAVGGIKRRSGVGHWCVLGFGTIVGFLPWVGRSLRAGRREILEALQGSFPGSQTWTLVGIRAGRRVNRWFW